MNTQVTVALVMPVRNEADVVDETMQAVFSSTRLPDEIIVADALSTDDTLEKLKAWENKGVPLKVVKNPSIYCGGGRNVGFKETDCEVILIADFGNPMLPGYIEEMVRPFEEQQDVDVTMGILQPLMTTDFEHCMGLLYFDENIKLKDYSQEQKEALVPDVLLPGGGCIAMTKHFWAKMGGYPEWLARSQDRLFSLKAYCSEAKVVVAWDAYSYNHVRNCAKDVFKMAYGWARCNGQSRYIRRHMLKAVPFYSLLLSLVFISYFSLLSLVAFFIILTLYVLKSGGKRLIKIDGRIKKPIYLWHLTKILVAGDVGSIVGHVVGWFEWFFKEKYRKQFWDYMNSCPKDKLHIVER